jgi:DNA-binding transcriptional ArsR family regulator
MVNYSAAHLNSIFSALADPTRRAILAQLSEGESALSALETPHRMSLPGLMKHLSVLEGAGLVEREKMGRVVHCRLAAEPLKEAAFWIDEYRRFWDQRLDSLANYLSSNKTKGE